MADETIPFTAKESEFISACIQYLRGTMDTDWEKVAKLCKLKDGSSAKGTWNNMARKRGIGGGGPRNNKRKPRGDPEVGDAQGNGASESNGAKLSKLAHKRARTAKKKQADPEGGTVKVKAESSVDDAV